MSCLLGFKSRVRRLKSGEEKKRTTEFTWSASSCALREQRHRQISEPHLVDGAQNKVEFLLNFKVNDSYNIPKSPSGFDEGICPGQLASSEEKNSRLRVATDERWIRRLSDTILNGESASCDPPKPPRMDQWKVFTCQNRNCRRTEILLGRIQISLKSCRFCFTHYCSAYCENAAKPEHLKICYYGRIHRDLEKALKLLADDEQLNRWLHDFHWQHFSQDGRGLVVVTFSSPMCLRKFIKCKRFSRLHESPMYSTSQEVTRLSAVHSQQLESLALIKCYEPCSEFVVNLTVTVERRLPVNPVPRMKTVIVAQTAIIPSNDSEATIQRTSDETNLPSQERKAMSNRLLHRNRRKTL